MSAITNGECSSCNRVYTSEELVSFKCSVSLNDMADINIKMNICANCIDNLYKSKPAIYKCRICKDTKKAKVSTGSDYFDTDCSCVKSGL